MSRNYPTKIPERYQSDEKLADAYRRGWSHGHGIACHNVPKLGKQYWTESFGYVVATPENIREVHESLCFEAEANSRQFSDFEFTASEFNSEDDAEEVWEAFEEGVSDSIFADLEGTDYGA